MPFTQPFYRIIRPMIRHDSFFCNYSRDKRYSDDMNSLCRSYKLLENDLKKIFEYIEPCDHNSNTYSHRIYELLLRSATEFELNCKRILGANGYTINNNLNITDYFKIEKATRLSEYKIYLDIWKPERKVIQPFIQWQDSHSLSWYKAYNDVKHDRQNNFHQANLNNLLQAIAGVCIILFSQFSIYSFNAYQRQESYTGNDDGAIFSGESLFSILPANWPDDDKYDFEWEELKSKPEPFVKFNF